VKEVTGGPEDARRRKPAPDELITLAEAARWCELSTASLRRYAWEGKLKARKMGPVWVTTLRAVEEYLGGRQRKRRPEGFD